MQNTTQLMDGRVDQKTLDLCPMHRLFVETYLKNSEDKRQTASDLGKTAKQIDEYLHIPKVMRALEYYKRGVIGIPNTEVDKEYKVEKSSQIKLLWDIAQTAAGKIYDREGNEVLMNPAGAIAAVRTISDLQGDFAPKEQHMTVDVKDERSVEEIQANVKMLMAEYQQLALNAGATDNQVNSVLKGPKNMELD